MQTLHDFETISSDISLRNHDYKKLFPDMKSYRVKEGAKGCILTQYFCLLRIDSMTISEFQWNLQTWSMLADTYLNAYIYRRVIFLD